MDKKELIALAKELAELDSLAGRGADLEKLKREYKRLAAQDEESYSDKLANAELERYYKILAEREGSLCASNYDDKKAIVAKAQAILSRNDIVRASKELDGLFEEFKKVGRCTKEQDDELWGAMKVVRHEFNAKKDAYFAALSEKNAAKRAQKKEIIEKAKAVLAIENIKEATGKMDGLMDEWKAVGFSGKEDDALWEEFNGIRKEFSAKRKAHFEAMAKAYAERAEKKEALIKELRFFIADTNYSAEDTQKIKEFRARWKEIGFAGREKDDALYQEFDGAIQQYFDDKKAYMGR